MTESPTDALDRAVRKALQANPEFMRGLAQHQYDTTPPEKRFPGGLRYRYYRVPPRPHFVEWRACYSTVRNENGKFVSWLRVYNAAQTKAKQFKFREHRVRRKAKLRAKKFYDQRQAAVSKVIPSE